ncbi:MAG: alpha/beta hydrolase family protein [Armatimonadota bacterium]
MRRMLTAIALGLVGLIPLAASAQISTLSFAVGDQAALPGTITAGKTIEVDLSAIPKGTAIVRALLRPGRNERQAIGQRNQPVTVTPAGSDEPLPLMPPRYRAFDATAAVAKAVRAGAGTVAFDVVSFPGYQPGDTRLDVTCSLAPRHKIPRVEGMRAWHHAGQTFITWQEPDPPLTADDVTFREWKALRQEMRRQPKQARYRIYRCNRPFSAATVAEAELVDEVGPLTCWNPDFYGISPKDDQTVPRYVVRDGEQPVPPGTGIYVHNPKQAGKSYYAVSVAINGEEDLSTFDRGNATRQPVAETVGLGEPALQRVVRPEKHFNYVEDATLNYYVRWEAPPNCNLPSTPYDYLVALPADLPQPAPVGLHLHCWGGSLNGGYGWWYNAAQGAILVSTNQIPYDWWTGYHEHRGTWLSWSQGVVRDYTQTRLMSFLDWVGTKWEVDPNRIFAAGSSMGGSGSPNLGIRWADRIAWVVSWVGVHTPARSPQFKGSYEGVYGKLEWQLNYEDGKTPAFSYFDDEWYLRREPGLDTPLICFSNGKNDGAIGWPQARDFWKALQDTRRPHVFIWGQGGHGQRARLPGPDPGQRELGVDVRLDRTLPAFTRCSLDDDPGKGDPEDGDPEGQSNLYLYWDSADQAIVDEANRWALTLRLGDKAPQAQCTVDVTPRRCQRFRPEPGAKLVWTNTALADDTEVQSGETTPDEWGLVTVPQVTVTTAGNRLTISVAGS